MDEYKMAIKKVDLNFDGDHYDNLIFGEPYTPAPEDPVGLEQLDLIGTPGAAAEQEVVPSTEPEKDATTEQAQEEAPDQLTSQQAVDQPPVPPASS